MGKLDRREALGDYVPFRLQPEEGNPVELLMFAPLGTQRQGELDLSSPEDRELLDEAWKAHVRLERLESGLDASTVKEVAASYQQADLLRPLVAPIVAYHAALKHVEYLARAGRLPGGDPQLDDEKLSRLVDSIAAALRPTLESSSVLEDLTRFLWVNLTTWMTDSMEAELGPRLEGLSDEERAAAYATYCTANAETLGKRIRALLYLYSRDLARLCIETVDFSKAMLSELQALIEGAEAGSPATLPAFALPKLPGEMAETDGSALYHRLREAMASGGFAPAEGNRWPTAFLAGNNLRATAQLKPDPVEIEPFLGNSELAEWQDRMLKNVMDMNDITADVLDIISAVWLRQADHPEAMATLTADDFLHLRGLQRQKSGSGRRGGYKEEWRWDIARHIAILSQTWITVDEREITEAVEGKKGKYYKRSKWRGESKAVVVSSRFGQAQLGGGLDVHAWRVRPGDVFSKFLFGKGRETALLSWKALEYDPYRQRWEKRLTRYLCWQARIRHAYPMLFRVQTLLEAAKENADSKHPSWTKERLERALETLQADGVIATWQYETADEAIIGKRGWVQSWLAWKIKIEMPQVVIDQYAKISEPERSRKPQPPGSLDGNAIKQARRERGLTQMQAAEEIGIDQSRLARIEHGEKPNAENRKRLEAWLASQG